jgi:hypothetical protein
MSVTESAVVRLVAKSPSNNEYTYGPFTIPSNYLLHSFTYKGVKALLETNPETSNSWMDNEIASWSFGIQNSANVSVRCTQFVLEKITGAVGTGDYSWYEGRLL